MEAKGEKRGYTREEYLRLEAEAEYKSEFYDGEIYAMAGGSHHHSLIAGNVMIAAGALLEGNDCEIHGSDLKVLNEAVDTFTYPDAIIICGQPEFPPDTNNAITNPKVIFEVLSESTSAWDRGGKFQRYRLIESLEEYVLIEQDQMLVEVFQKDSEGNWRLRDYNGPAAVMRLSSVDVEIPLERIYRRVDFSESDTGLAANE